MEFDYGKIISGIAVELAKLALEEVKYRINRRKNPRKIKKGNSRKKKS